MYDASNRKDIRKAEKEARLAEVARLDYLKAAMSTWQGRAWFYDILEFCHIFSDPFSGQALIEAYSKGERNVGLRIFADLIAHTPDDYILMVKESDGRRIERDSRDARAAAAELSGSQDPGWDPEGHESDYAFTSD